MSSPAIRQTLAQADHPAQATPATTESFVIGESQLTATVTEVSIVPSTTQAGVNTTTRTFTVTNTGATGVGTTPIATFTTDVAGGGFTANDERLMTLNATASNLNVTAGDVLACVETVGSTGAAHPALQIVVRGTARSV